MKIYCIEDILNDNEFVALCSNIIYNEKFLKLKEYRHHKKITVYEHSLKVAYYSFLAMRKKYDVDKDILSAALLHDYYLYDWHDRKKYPRKGLHGYMHALVSAKNAKRDFDISDKTYSIISKHMFPLNLTKFPTSRGDWLVGFEDKKATLLDCLFSK